MPQTVYVIMSNDYPVAVFDNESNARIFLNMKEDEEKEKQGRFHTRVYWRIYPFPLRSTQHEVPS